MALVVQLHLAYYYCSAAQYNNNMHVIQYVGYNIILNSIIIWYTSTIYSIFMWAGKFPSFESFDRYFIRIEQIYNKHDV